jgi:hypothetical protein
MLAVIEQVVTAPAAWLWMDNGFTWLDARTYWLLGCVLGLLVVAFVISQFLRRQPETTVNPALVHMFNQRIRAWWLMCVRSWSPGCGWSALAR